MVSLRARDYDSRGTARLIYNKGFYHGALSVANYFIDKSKETDTPINGVVRLMHLVYIAQGWSLALDAPKDAFDSGLFSEDVIATELGPTINSVYHSFKNFKNDVIDEKSSVFDTYDLDNTVFCPGGSRYVNVYKVDHDINNNMGDVYPSIPNVDSIDSKQARLILDKVWQGYSKLTNPSIFWLTMVEKCKGKNESAPWQDVKIGDVISKDKMRDHFKHKLNMYFGDIN